MKNSKEKQFRECPYCKEEILSSAIKCKHCKSSIQPDKPSHNGICPYCKEEIKPEAIKCKHCETTLFFPFNVRQRSMGYTPQRKSLPQRFKQIDLSGKTAPVAKASVYRSFFKNCNCRWITVYMTDWECIFTCPADRNCYCPPIPVITEVCDQVPWYVPCLEEVNLFWWKQ